MRRELPGSVLTYEDSVPHGAAVLMDALFAGGDLMLAQVARMSGLEPYMIQNWVTRGFLPPPEGKRYTRRQLCRILLINLLRGVLPLESITGLLSYVNGHLDDISDDTVDDSRLYLWMLEVLDAGDEEAALAACLEEYREPVPGAGKRLEKVLRVLRRAAMAARLQKEALGMIGELKTEGGTEE